MDKLQLRLKLTKLINSNDLAPLSCCEPRLNLATLAHKVTNFVAAYPSFAKTLFNYHGHVPYLGTRLGRGEVLTWYLFDDVELGGSSTSTDVFIGGRPTLEIKCGKLIGDRYTDFMLGIDEVQASFKFAYKVLKLFEKNDRAGKLTLPPNFANISKRKLDELKRVSATAFRCAEDEYFIDLLTGPIGAKKYLIFDKETCLPVFVGQLKRSHLQLERISGGLTRLTFLFTN